MGSVDWRRGLELTLFRKCAMSPVPSSHSVSTLRTAICVRCVRPEGDLFFLNAKRTHAMFYVPFLCEACPVSFCGEDLLFCPSGGDSCVLRYRFAIETLYIAFRSLRKLFGCI